MQEKGGYRASGTGAVAPQIASVPAAISTKDETLLRLRLNGRSRHTMRAYEADVRAMLATVGKPLAAVTLADLQAWTGSLALAALAPASRARKIATVKSLLSFAERILEEPTSSG